MNNVLFINACVRPDSRTHRLAREVLKKLPGETEELNLYGEQIPPLDLEALADTFFGIPETVCFSAQNLDIIGADVEGILEQTIAGIRAARFA